MQWCKPLYDCLTSQLAPALSALARTLPPASELLPFVVHVLVNAPPGATPCLLGRKVV